MAEKCQLPADYRQQPSTTALPDSCPNEYSESKEDIKSAHESSRTDSTKMTQLAFITPKLSAVLLSHDSGSTSLRMEGCISPSCSEQENIVFCYADRFPDCSMPALLGRQLLYSRYVLMESSFTPHDKLLVRSSPSQGTRIGPRFEI